MCDKIYTLDEIKAIAAPIASRHGVAALYLFGSYARGEATPSSDLDFRIEKGFSKDLDVLTTQMLTPDFLNRIRPEEVLIYARS